MFLVPQLTISPNCEPDHSLTEKRKFSCFRSPAGDSVAVFFEPFALIWAFELQDFPGIKRGLHPNLEKFSSDQTKKPPRSEVTYVYSPRNLIFLRRFAKNAVERSIADLLWLTWSKTLCQGIAKSFTPRGWWSLQTGDFTRSLGCAFWRNHYLYGSASSVEHGP